MANDSSVINPVIIVGAGLSGLALTYRLERLGIAPVIVDGAANVGAIWRHRYEQLRLNTHRRFSQLPGLAPPRNGGAYLSRDTVIRYLEDYERLLAASVEYGVHVKRIDREGDVWRVHTAQGVRKARHVVIATGRERIPNLPVWPGLGKYEGNLLHAAEFGNVEAYRDLAILVVGGGNSGVDLLNHLVTIPTRGLWLAVRNGVNVIPASLWGAPVHRLSGVMSWLPNRVVDRLMALTGLLAFGRLDRYGLPRCSRGARYRQWVRSRLEMRPSPSGARRRAVPRQGGRTGGPAPLASGCGDMRDRLSHRPGADN